MGKNTYVYFLTATKIHLIQLSRPRKTTAFRVNKKFWYVIVLILGFYNNRNVKYKSEYFIKIFI